MAGVAGVAGVAVAVAVAVVKPGTEEAERDKKYVFSFKYYMNYCAQLSSM